MLDLGHGTHKTQLSGWKSVAYPNWPETSDQVSEFFRRLTVMLAMRWHAHDETGGTGHFYQGRFKSYPIQSDGHQLTVMRYVEQNPERAKFTELAEDGQRSSAYARRQRADERRWLAISDGPPLPRNWRSGVNKVEAEAELTSLRHLRLHLAASSKILLALFW